MYEYEIGDRIIFIGEKNYRWLKRNNTYTIKGIHKCSFNFKSVDLVELPRNECGDYFINEFIPDYRVKKINKIKQRIFDISK